MDPMFGYRKTKDFLICIDSDGCAMDTMDLKHVRCFGPCMIEEWNLKKWRDEIIARWNAVNLYTMTRGINRFKALSIILSEIDRRLCSIEGIGQFSQWVSTSDELSNDALIRQIQSTPQQAIFQKALSWSQKVNSAIAKDCEPLVKPFNGVLQALQFCQKQADIAIVSSGDPNAIRYEWDTNELLQYTQTLLAQNAGSKPYCISRLLEQGYDPKKVLICGDAVSDLEAAEQCGIAFFPILVHQESLCWDRFLKEALPRFFSGTFNTTYQAQLIQEFKDHLGG